ncbi:DNA-3-methyladenine glycosylase I [Pseudohalocynthiibacter aestuariivivens]|jgi:DNA-3-methyladenine glycosylase I|uniref:DNA-3-methyladenine glycosylase I n=1 Tax=Pseudohalocynthiibacter aestuariivivens TaxID=1591409 RepID=A0ABV5JI87_9RHOB|nr:MULTISPECIES: DNA-3-methyladenine glycosylase I [Pseudohalocynthiibacter]MBS9717477.1 DNA-3-methyladenine glycosylase I [Pseudohalocynthiibacter aestuariivivens]MCK0102188.1 DNA-3-methyladenine glycosylase I [Pseudohalocynthiibacter sp. F2068]
MNEACSWVGDSEIYRTYHDTEWGVPEYDSRALWEKLILDGFQAGLSWITILKKRENFRAAFKGFDPNVIAKWGEDDVLRLLADSGIVRHRGKIEATIGNARAWQVIEAREGFDQFLWRYVGGAPLQNQFKTQAEVPTETALSRQVSKDLKAAGFRFCGPTIVYAFMEAVGMVNDHLIGCPCHEKIADFHRQTVEWRTSARYFVP